MPNEGVDDEAVVLAGGAEEGPGEDVALGVAELMGGGVDEVGPGDGLCGRPVGEDGATSAPERCSIVMGTWPDFFLARSVAGLSAGQGMPPGRGLGLEGVLGAVGEAGGDGAHGGRGVGERPGDAAKRTADRLVVDLDVDGRLWPGDGAGEGVTTYISHPPTPRGSIRLSDGSLSLDPFRSRLFRSVPGRGGGCGFDDEAVVLAGNTEEGAVKPARVFGRASVGDPNARAPFLLSLPKWWMAA